MFSNAIIGLREGLEAALVVGILLAYIARSGRQHLSRALWGGVAAAVVLSIGVSVALSRTSEEFSERGQEMFAGVASLTAVALVTWMIFWMKRTARTIKSELQGKLDVAMSLGPIAVAGIAFVAVAREGVETSLFLWTSANAGLSQGRGLIGAAIGLAIAMVLGRAIYKGSVKINLSKFFRISGIALIIIAAGVLAYGIAELQEVHWLPGEDLVAWDLSAYIPETSVLAMIIDGLAGFSVHMTVLQLAAWAVYTSVVMTLFLRASKTQATAAVSPAAETQPQPVGAAAGPQH